VYTETFLKKEMPIGISSEICSFHYDTVMGGYIPGGGARSLIYRYKSLIWKKEIPIGISCSIIIIINIMVCLFIFSKLPSSRAQGIILLFGNYLHLPYEETSKKETGRLPPCCMKNVTRAYPLACPTFIIFYVSGLGL
jgi:hypothetical protein